MSAVQHQSRFSGQISLKKSGSSSAPRNYDKPSENTGENTGEKTGERTGETARVEHPILFQTYFKSVGPRTYAVQVKRASNNNHYIVLTEGRRDEKSGEIRKNRINIFSEDFPAFWNLLSDLAKWVRSHPVPPKVASRQAALWKKRAAQNASPASSGIASKALSALSQPAAESRFSPAD